MVVTLVTRWATASLFLLGFFVMPSVAGAVTVVPNDPTTTYSFGWSTSRQVDAGQPAPIVLQYDYDFGPGNPIGQSCNALDKLDEAVRAFRYRNDDGAYRVQMSF